MKYLPQAIISSRQAAAARLLLPRSHDTALSTSFTMLKLLAEELKATDYTLTQSSLDQVSESDSTIRPRTVVPTSVPARTHTGVSPDSLAKTLPPLSRAARAVPVLFKTSRKRSRNFLTLVLLRFSSAFDKGRVPPRSLIRRMRKVLNFSLKGGGGRSLARNI